MNTYYTKNTMIKWYGFIVAVVGAVQYTGGAELGV